MLLLIFLSREFNTGFQRYLMEPRDGAVMLQEPEPGPWKLLRSQAAFSPSRIFLLAAFWKSTLLSSLLGDLFPLLLSEQDETWHHLCPREKWAGIFQFQQQDHKKVSLTGQVKTQSTMARGAGYNHDCPMGRLVPRVSGGDWADIPESIYSSAPWARNKKPVC